MSVFERGERHTGCSTACPHLTAPATLMAWKLGAGVKFRISETPPVPFIPKIVNQNVFTGNIRPYPVINTSLISPSGLWCAAPVHCLASTCHRQQRFEIVFPR